MPWESGRTDVAGRQGTLGDHLRKSKHRCTNTANGITTPRAGGRKSACVTVRRQHFARTPALRPPRKRWCHVWTARFCKGKVRWFLSGYGSSHVSGLLARCSRPLALMKSAGWVPLSPTSCDALTTPRGVPAVPSQPIPRLLSGTQRTGPSTNQQDAIDRDGREVETDQTSMIAEGRGIERVHDDLRHRGSEESHDTPPGSQQRPAAATRSTAAKPTVPICHGKLISGKARPCVWPRWWPRLSRSAKWTRAPDKNKRRPGS